MPDKICLGSVSVPPSLAKMAWRIAAKLVKAFQYGQLRFPLMSTLYLLRHAHAGSAEPGMTDFDRPLDARGVYEAKLISAQMRAKGLIPHKILCSPSVRTRQTLAEISRILPAETEVIFQDLLYTSDAPGYLSAISGVEQCPSLLVIGHNPSTEELADALVQTGEKNAMELLKRGFPTAALACLEFGGPLASIASKTATLSSFFRPADL